ncbi:MAG: HU family DNA-binding protein [Bacteroidaceae bacterium]|nr:HU family DNA-binding protein [Bacteroidaceae bacterium]
MTQKQFINELAKNSGMTTSETTQLMEQFCTLVTECVNNDQTVMLQGFGSFEKKTKAERQMYNPATKDYRTIPGSTSLVFKPSTLLKDKLNPQQ